MSREIDRRDFSADQAPPERASELQDVAREVSEALPGDHSVQVTQVDHTTGVPRVVSSRAAPAEAENFVARALEHVQAIAPVFGLVRVSPEFAVDEHVQRTASGAAAVQLQQQHRGIPIFQATETVRFNADGSVRDTAGSSVPVEGAYDAEPELGVQEAVRRAAEHVAHPDEDERGAVDQFGVAMEPHEIDLSGFEPQIVGDEKGSPDRATRLTGPPFEGEIDAALIWFPMPEGLHLAWETLLNFPDYLARYRTLVDATDGEILYSHQLVAAVAARGNVYRVDGSNPREMIDFPQPIASYALSVHNPPPTGFPEEWVEDEHTSGNCAHAHLGVAGPAFQGAQVDGVLTFDPADDEGDDQKVLNIFYFNCFMHDYCYLLGFREADGNFQQDNFNRGGIASDPVDARAHSGPVKGTANMATLEDGEAPIMNMGLVPNTNRHTALDSSVVFHEFMHGVTNRTVGGPADNRSLESPQSVGMGEGWSDWIACTINDTEIVGAWVVDNRNGIRRHRYDDQYPDNFGELGSGIYAPGTADEHDVGEIWCATLLSLNRKLGVPLSRQLVLDSLRLSAANPSFLNMRDDILHAAELMDTAGQLDRAVDDVKKDIWSVFAHFGMGFGARSQGAQLQGIVADFSEPSP